MTHGWNLWCQQDVWLGAVLYVASSRAMSFYTQRSPFYIAVLRVMKQNIITGPGTVHHCPIDSQWTLMWQGRTSSHGCRKGKKMFSLGNILLISAILCWCFLLACCRAYGLIFRLWCRHEFQSLTFSIQIASISTECMNGWYNFSTAIN